MFPSLPWRIGRAGLRVRRSLLSRQSTARTSVATVAMCALARPSPAIRWPLGRCWDCSFEGSIVKANRRCALPSSLLPSRPAWQLRQDRPPTVDAERTARTMPRVRTTAEVKVDEVTDPEATVPQTDNHMTPATSDPMAETPAAACHQRPGGSPSPRPAAAVNAGAFVGGGKTAPPSTTLEYSGHDGCKWHAQHANKRRRGRHHPDRLPGHLLKPKGRLRPKAPRTDATALAQSTAAELCAANLKEADALRATVHQLKHEWQRIMQAMLNWYETQARAWGVRSNPIEKTATAKTDAAQAGSHGLDCESHRRRPLVRGARRRSAPRPHAAAAAAALPFGVAEVRSTATQDSAGSRLCSSRCFCVDLAENVKGGAGWARGLPRGTAWGSVGYCRMGPRAATWSTTASTATRSRPSTPSLSVGLLALPTRPPAAETPERSILTALCFCALCSCRARALRRARARGARPCSRPPTCRCHARLGVDDLHAQPRDPPAGALPGAQLRIVAAESARLGMHRPNIAADAASPVRGHAMPHAISMHAPWARADAMAYA